MVKSAVSSVLTSFNITVYNSVNFISYTLKFSRNIQQIYFYDWSIFTRVYNPLNIQFLHQIKNREVNTLLSYLSKIFLKTNNRDCIFDMEWLSKNTKDVPVVCSMYNWYK